MRTFRCDRCDGVVHFTAHRCPTCDAPIGYVSDRRDLCVVVPTAEPAVFRLERADLADRPPMFRCLNSAWGCNWMVPADSGQVWCRSCRLTRGRPDEGRSDAIEAWMRAEAAKRRLVHQLDELALPIETASPSMPDGLVFDLVFLPGEGGITGHIDGVVTLDLAETDDAHRDHQRRLLGEPYRTVIGHLRHEIGHYFWDRLVGRSSELDVFRQLFGDERADYTDAIDRYYERAGDDWDRSRFVTTYAASHPLEDWAETFAHYLHIIDATDTAAAHGLVPDRGEGIPVIENVTTLRLVDILDAWRPVNGAVNAIAESLGSPAVYPFDPDGVVVDKLTFVHRQVSAHTDRFGTDH